MTTATPFVSTVDADVAAGVRLVGELLIRDIDAIAQALVAKILQNEPAYQVGRTITHDELTATVTETATGVFSAIAGAPLERARFEGNGRRRAASSIPLHAVLHAYRIGGLHHWECFARAAASLPLGDRIITEGSTTVWSIIDLASQYVTQGYSHEVEELHSRSAEEKAALLQQLLEGSLSADVEVWDAAAVLSLPVAGTFVLVATPTPRSEGDTLPRAERALARHNLRSAWLADPSSQLGLISLGTTSQLGRVVELLGAEAGGAIGMSDPFHEISAAPEALRQARIAMAAGSGAVPGVTAYSDVPLQAMLVLAPQSAEQLRQAVLGPLLDAPRGDSAVLMDTLQSWILAGGSATDCAKPDVRAPQLGGPTPAAHLRADRLRPAALLAGWGCCTSPPRRTGSRRRPWPPAPSRSPTASEGTLHRARCADAGRGTRSAGRWLLPDAGSTGSHRSQVAVPASGSKASIATISGPGRSRQGWDGNHVVAVAAQASCRAVGCGPSVRKTAQVPAATSMTSSPSGGDGGGGHALEIGELAALGPVGVEVGTDRQHAGRLGVVQALEAHDLLGRDRRDVLGDVRVDAFVDQRHALGPADEADGGQGGDAGVHGDAPFDGQAEPDPWLCAQGTPGAPYVARAGAVHRTERPPESLGRAVAVADRDREQVVVGAHQVGRGQRHPAPTDVLRQRHPGQRREHPPQMVLGGARARGEVGDVHRGGRVGRELRLDSLDGEVEDGDHRGVPPFAAQPAVFEARLRPIIPARSRSAVGRTCCQHRSMARSVAMVVAMGI